METAIDSSCLRCILNNMEKPFRLLVALSIWQKKKRTKQYACNGAFLGCGVIQHHTDCKLRNFQGYPRDIGMRSQSYKVGSGLDFADHAFPRLQLWKKDESATSTEATKTGGRHGSRRHQYRCKLYLWLDVLRGHSVGNTVTRV